MMARTAIASANDVKMTGISSEHRFLTDGNCGEEVSYGMENKKDDMRTCSNKGPLRACPQEWFYGHVSRG